ncbi:MAG: efflux RND transporter periplasmic adaptor subunit [Betaproteobacteria bacterium]|nr:efflux RND transporter periplasmic adaptor subunit [Betaproteobacteria bacterium]
MILAAAAVSWWYLFQRTEVDSDDAYVAGNIVPVYALAPGIVSKLGVDNSMPVVKGQWLLDEEKNVSQARLDKATADLAEAVRKTRSLFAKVQEQQADLAALATDRNNLVQDLGRYLQAEAAGAVPVQKISDTRAEIAVLDHKISAGQAHLNNASALVSGTSVDTNPLVLQARAEFVTEYINVHRASLYSPIDGYIANRRVQAGEMLKAGQYLMSVVPLDELWINANLKETRLARIRTGETVQILAHAYGDDVVYHGQIIGMDPSGGSTFSLFPPNNATGNYIHIVERIPVRISLSPAELRAHPLRPGMSVSVRISTENYASFAPLSTRVSATGKTYSTDLYDTEMQAAQKAAQSIIDGNQNGR